MELGYRDELLLSVLIEYFFLGYYWYLVLTCTLALLLSRMRLPGLLQLVLVTMFLISVAALSVDTIVVYREIDSPSGSYPFQLRRPRVILRVGNSAISQAIVSTRCLKLWPRNKFAMAATAVLFSASIATGIFGVSGDPSSIRGQMLVYNWTNMASTGILSGVIIARTLWMRKQVTKVYDPVHLDCYPKINMLWVVLPVPFVVHPNSQPARRCRIDSGIGFPVLALIDRLIPFNPLQAALVQIAVCVPSHYYVIMLIVFENQGYHRRSNHPPDRTRKEPKMRGEPYEGAQRAATFLDPGPRYHFRQHYGSFSTRRHRSDSFDAVPDSPAS
ncbi:hypothetical protein CC1G_15442 [Coprinopsis cinerea okayama7|uniref:Uncharacterized protein n=1 Tax=Coprinopsis cinerea (strain Okayama-7 / 130 / ATCC MYA-4618 / FGSC 9003) TaxID=240176 RepID=D6RQU4_COPC7|nr:hypothetical protein CC1G_15442 [Coprinopsis cinerea okayama7\|eukprot:XP_002910165.1 hypothetical protein CC1G_15442 [Coprinopsis cinerea okayama7\